MMVKCALLTTLALIVVGCKGTHVEVAGRRGESLQATDTSELLTAYAIEAASPSLFKDNKSHLRAEIERRGWFTAEQWALIDAGEVETGHPEGLVWAAWGPPDRVSSSYLDGIGTARALWYGQHQTWVYTDGKKITGYSN